MTGHARRIAEGALTSAGYLVMFLLAFYTPLGIVLSFLLPVPFLVYLVREGHSGAFVVVGVSFLLTFLFAGLPALFLTFFASCVGLAIGLVYQREKKALTMFTAGLLAALFSLVFFVLLANFLFEMNMVEEMRRALEESFAFVMQAMDKLGVAADEELLSQIPETMTRLFPFFLIFTSAAVSFTTFWTGGQILKRLGTHFPQFPPFFSWHLPRWVLFVYLAILLMRFIPNTQEVPFVGTALINLQPFFDLLFIIQGLAFVYFFARTKGWGRTPLVLAVIGLLLPPFSFLFTPFLSILGIIDTGMPLREWVEK